MLGLVGTNGIGKSTALKILAGKLKPNLGRFESPPDWQEILQHFRGSELQNYFTRILEDNLKVHRICLGKVLYAGVHVYHILRSSEYLSNLDNSSGIFLLSKDRGRSEDCSSEWSSEMYIFVKNYAGVQGLISSG